MEDISYALYWLLGVPFICIVFSRSQNIFPVLYINTTLNVCYLRQNAFTVSGESECVCVFNEKMYFINPRWEIREVGLIIWIGLSTVLYWKPTAQTVYSNNNINNYVHVNVRYLHYITSNRNILCLHIIKLQQLAVQHTFGLMRRGLSC